jgi:triacylglycerol esterase/lipase EstA (alpha/beta hydrolase family)
MLNRRRLLQGSAALAFAGFRRAAFAKEQAPVPIVFVHGDSDLAATWETQIWRFESNGYPRDRLFAISFTDPQARDDDTVAQANRSSTEDQLRELTAFIEDVKVKTGAPKVAIVALSRRLRDARICRRQSRQRRKGGARGHAQPRRLGD